MGQSQEERIITLYDIPSNLPPKAWSLNMWKSRFALNFKGLPHKTYWVECPDIEPTMKAIGGAPTAKRADGSDLYTCPVISDPGPGGHNTPAVISDSWNIALYLDKAYPSGPLLFPSDTAVLQEVYIQKIEELVQTPVLLLLLSFLPAYLNPPSVEFFVKARELSLGLKLEEWCPEGAARENAVRGLEMGLSKLAGLLDRHGDVERMFVAGAEPVYADLFLASLLEFMRSIAEEEIWSLVKVWNGGRWDRFLSTVKSKYGRIC